MDINTKVLFVHMLLKANWKEGKFRDTTVPRGSFISSYPRLAEECSMTINEIRTALKHLKSTGEVTVKTNNKYSVFTVNNYCQYQDSNSLDDIQGTCNAQTVNIPLTTIEEARRTISNKEDAICSEPEKSAPNPSGILLPLNDKSFYNVPSDKLTMWAGTYPAVNVEQELKRMIAWLDSNPAKKKTRRGIERFINNWLARTQDGGGTKGREEVSGAVGNNAYDTDARRKQLSRAIAEAGRDFNKRNDLPFK